jgi:rubrerythrin
MELMAGLFYGAVAQAVDDPEVHALIRRLLRDEGGTFACFAS